MKLSSSSVLHGATAPTQFHCREPDNLLRVEQTSECSVVICTAKANFDSAQRRTFVLYLKAEGFIPKKARLIIGDGKAGTLPSEVQILWVFDPCWPYTEVKFNHYSRRRCARLLFGPTLIWLLLMWFVA